MLAAMVVFQPDSDARTTGNGEFDTTVSNQQVIDPAPHDRIYFQNHLTFTENYFRKVSDGKVIIQDTVLDSVYRLPHKMSYYSPARTSSDNVELGYLMGDVWHTIDSVTHGGIPFGKYQAFVIFHAGVGRDIDLASCLGYDPTPYDIPSIYLNIAGLRKMFGSSYPGVIVRGGLDTITNSMIIPETESRDNPCTFPTTVLQLGINGLLAASVGSHLGLPDLFDTQTGASGIGRFGLMDGQAIFSWGGLFPPEPSAWEKCFLGWVNPLTVASGDTLYDLPAVSLTQNDTIYRVLISEKEYFLVENRNRDPNRNGNTATIVRNGVTTQMVWFRDTTGLNEFYQDSLYGVLINVDDFDWSLPVIFGSATGAFPDGGILIWHIDENVIEADIASNTINANPDRRGVNLMEADGSQDIGQSYGLLDAGYLTDAGTRWDFWFDGNEASLRIRSNAFTPTSYPSSASNDGANSHVYIENFSVPGSRMTARIQVGDEVVKPLAGFPRYTGQQFGANSLAIENDPGGLAKRFVISTQNFGVVPKAAPPGEMASQQVGPSKMFAWNTDGTPALAGGDSSGEILSAVGTFGSFTGKVAVGSFVDTLTDFAVGGVETNVISPPAGQGLGMAGIWHLKDQNHDLRIDSLFKTPLSRHVTTSPVISDSFLAVGASHGFVYLIRFGGSVAESLQISPSDSSDVVSLSLFNNPCSYVAVTSNGSVAMLGGTCSQSSSVLVPGGSGMQPSEAVAGAISAKYGKEIILAYRDGRVSLVSPSTFSPLTGFPIATGGGILGAPALADIDGDGQRDIVVFSGNRIFAINAGGAILDHFPITVPTGKTILSSPIVADVDGNGTVDIVAVTQEGLVVAYDRTGTMLNGFPIIAGVNGGSTPVAFYLPRTTDTTDVGLAVASDDGHVYAWRTGAIKTSSGTPPPMPWPQYMHDAQNTGLADSILQFNPAISEFFPNSRAYNWPNPVDAAHGYKTHIRYYVHDDSRVHIKIFDLAGDAVTEFDGPGQGGLDNEIEWDVSHIQSGIYFAHIEAQGITQRGVAVIKIAVIK